MKKLVSVTLLLMCLFFSAMAFAEDYYSTPVTGKVISTRAGVRVDTDEDLEAVKYFKNGETFKIIGEIGDWFIVSDNSLEDGKGYMMKKLIILNPTKLTTCAMVDVYAMPYGDKCIAVTPSHSEYTIIGEYNEYFCINVNGGSGFVLKSAPILTDVQISNYQNTSSETGRVKDKESPNVRSGPGSAYKSYGKLKPGETVQIVGQEGNWYVILYKVKDKDVVGYVSVKYIQR